jgi:preprotein translocase subunit SecF
MEIFKHDAAFDFLRWRKVSLVISALLVVLSIGAIFTRGLNYGLDFTGGILISVKYQQPIDTGEVRSALAKAGFDHAIVQSVGGAREVSIRLQPDRDKAATEQSGSVKQSDKVAADVMAALKASRSDATMSRDPDYVGPEVGDELKSDGVTAVIFVIIGIMIYIGVRFEWRFAIAAIASEFHDTLLTIGFYALTQHEFDITVLASVLAVVGYSINDKVVVFDRVRELFRATRKGEPVEILNKAINGTLSRTIITSLFTGITMIALYFFGGPAVHGFALTMIIGIIIGTLSSIFFASPILLWLGVSKKDLMPVTRDNPELARRP